MSARAYSFWRFIFLAFGEIDRKHAEREEGGVTCNKDPQQDSNQGCCGYVACTPTIRLPVKRAFPQNVLAFNILKDDKLFNEMSSSTSNNITSWFHTVTKKHHNDHINYLFKKCQAELVPVFLWHLMVLVQPHITSTDRNTSLPLVLTALPLDAAGVSQRHSCCINLSRGEVSLMRSRCNHGHSGTLCWLMSREAGGQWLG